jgi:hypothetical protein
LKKKGGRRAGVRNEMRRRLKQTDNKKKSLRAGFAFSTTSKRAREREERKKKRNKQDEILSRVPLFSLRPSLSLLRARPGARGGRSADVPAEEAFSLCVSQLETRREKVVAFGGNGKKFKRRTSEGSLFFFLSFFRRVLPRADCFSSMSRSVRGVNAKRVIELKTEREKRGVFSLSNPAVWVRFKKKMELRGGKERERERAKE